MSEARLRAMFAAESERSRGALEQSMVCDALHERGECGGRPGPCELIDVVEERRIGPQRGQLLEKQRLVAALAEHLRREGFDGPMAIQQPRRADAAQSRDTRISVGAVADEGEKVGNQGGFHPELFADSLRVADLLA